MILFYRLLGGPKNFLKFKALLFIENRMKQVFFLHIATKM